MDYFLFDPSGNITALLPVSAPDECRIEFADAVMQREPAAEQAGFVLPGSDTCDIELRMAGGEFCGNASLCTAALYALQNDLQAGRQLQVRLRASGCANILSVLINANPDNTFTGCIEMPQIREIRQYDTGCPELPQAAIAATDGITHAVIPDVLGPEWAESHIKAWCADLHAEAMGMMLVNADASEITPIVYVPASNTLFREHSCASGSAAVGVWLARQNGRKTICDFKEPGGTLRVTASPDGIVTLENNIYLQAHSYI